MALKFWPFFLGFAMSAACATSSELERTRTVLETRLTALETNDQQRRRQLQEAVEQATSQVRTLTAPLEVRAAGTATVVQDELQNTYQRHVVAGG